MELISTTCHLATVLSFISILYIIYWYLWIYFNLGRPTARWILGVWLSCGPILLSLSLSLKQKCINQVSAGCLCFLDPKCLESASDARIVPEPIRALSKCWLRVFTSLCSNTGYGPTLHIPFSGFGPILHIHYKRWLLWTSKHKWSPVGHLYNWLKDSTLNKLCRVKSLS